MRIKGSILSSCNKLFNCIIYYSNPDNNDYDQAVKDHANKIASSCFSKLGKHGRKFKYTGKIRSFDIRKDDVRCFKHLSCSCPSFVKWALCPHAVAYSYVYSLDIYGKDGSHSPAL